MTQPNSPNRTLQQTLQQKRAAHAWSCIVKVDGRKTEKNEPDEKFKKRYGSLVRGLSSLVQSDGLGQMLAFLKAKDKNKGNTEHIEAYTNISNWISIEFGVTYKQGETLLEWLLTQETPMYRRVTAEALAYLNWLKRFAEAKDWQDEE
jgi:CRISPR-associated protein Cmr5